MKTPIRKLSGANMDIDLTTQDDQIDWQQDQCPWNRSENTDQHRCAIKNISICKYFLGVEYLDTVWCCYPKIIQESKGRPTFIIQGPSVGNADLCKPILEKLPDWFGINEANQRYLEDIDRLPTFLAFDDHQVVGFLTLKRDYLKTAEVYIIGVLPQYHRCGLGREMLYAAESYLRDEGVVYLQVKTLSDSHPDPGYAKTRAFYLAMGFTPLEAFDSLWDDNNPALQFIKTV